ncbi:hypothetical protein SAMN05216356_1312 [Oribacterium sp. WCC10]|nr:hypothetical protein SAMN05216356_1312 [Oribacterium sp. WCC10]
MENFIMNSFFVITILILASYIKKGLHFIFAEDLPDRRKNMTTRIKHRIIK